ncbi:MAG: dihydropteroate synthase [Desulfobacteraceae bacterium]|jgi:5-methyltetrahydrofolate corrinoid/iron sulfur protein methyltransferase
MILVADNLRITHAAITRALNERDPAPITQVVQACEKAGACAIDINTGPLTRDPESKMTFMVQTVQNVTHLPLLLDTVNPKAIEAGVKASNNPIIINGFSLEPLKLKYVLPIAKAHNCQIIGYLLRTDGHVPADATERLNVAVKLYEQFKLAGLQDNQLIIDPVIVPVSWQDGCRQNKEILEVLSMLPDLLGFPVKTIAGLSNLTAGGRDKSKCRLLQQTYLAMLAANNLDMALCNVLSFEIISCAKASQALTQPDIFTWEALPGS